MSQPTPINTSHQQQHEIPSQCDSGSNFTQDEIQIIRSYIGDLSIQKRQNAYDNFIDKVVEKIQKETQLQMKSAKHIQELIYKLIGSGESGDNVISGGMKVEGERTKMEEDLKLVGNNVTVLPSTIQTKPIPPTITQDTQSFPTRSLFKSWNQPTRNPTFTVPQSSQPHPSPAFRKINLFTQPSIQILKSSSSNNGFISLNNDNKFSMMMQIQNNNNNETIEIPSFSKKSTNQFKQTVQSSSLFISKRKIKPTLPLLIDPLYSPQEKIQWSQSNTHDCHLILEKKMGRKANVQGKDGFYVNERLSGIYNQYFYSNYDRAYFSQQNQISKLINYLGYGNKIYHLTHRQQETNIKVVQDNKISTSPSKSIQLLVHFKSNFQIELIQKPIETGPQIGNLLKQHIIKVDKQILYKRTKQQLQLVVGRQVTALHPVCGHLHLGTILAIYKENQYMVKFIRPELGTQKVLDINISTRSLSNTNKSAVQNIDYESMVVVIKLLEYKGDLIEKFREYNNTIQMLKSQNKQPDNHLLQEYGWVGSMINILSMGLRHIMSKFRIRGLNAANQQLVGKNFSSLLINPLNLMSKQLQLSPQQSDIETSNQIRKMAHNRSNMRIEEALKRLVERHGHYLQEAQMNPQDKLSMNALIKSFLGILLNLRFEGRNFNLQSNKFLDSIQKIIDPQYAEEFNEIHSSMHSIVKRINENQ